MAPDIKYIPIEPVEQRRFIDKLADKIWGKSTEIVVCILLLILAVPILGVMVKWTLHQLAVMG